VAGPLILALLYKGPAWGLFLLIIIAVCIGAAELFSMSHPGDRASQGLGVALSAGVSGLTYFGTQDPRAFLLAIIGTNVMAPLYTLFRLGDIRTAAFRASALGMGPLFIGVPLTLLAVLRRDMGADGPGYVVLALMVAWFGDTGGYFGGRFFGKHKLYEAVSPKKTIEGAIAGLLGSAIGALLAHFVFLKSLPLVAGIVVAIVGGALGQAGDLGESLFKRSTGVKDSGNIVPGHGGILDRVDALMLASVTIYAYAAWFAKA
jgi:phosphatidate cytidylyltransferase